MDASRPFPHLANKKINIALSLKQTGSEDTVHAIVQIPSILPRYIKIGDSAKYVLIEDAILMHLPAFFKGYTIGEIGLFKITRNGDLFIDEEAQDLLLEIEKSLKKIQPIFDRENLEKE